MAKDELYRWLRQDRPTDEDLDRGTRHPPGYCHFPRYSEEYFKQLTAERLVTRIVKGYRRPEWQKMRERNEARDARVYARAAASRVGIERFHEEHWASLERRIAGSRGIASTPSAPSSNPASNWGPRSRVRFRMDI